MFVPTSPNLLVSSSLNSTSVTSAIMHTTRPTPIEGDPPEINIPSWSKVIMDAIAHSAGEYASLEQMRPPPFPLDGLKVLSVRNMQHTKYIFVDKSPQGEGLRAMCFDKDRLLALRPWHTRLPSGTWVYRVHSKESLFIVHFTVSDHRARVNFIPRGFDLVPHTEFLGKLAVRHFHDFQRRRATHAGLEPKQLVRSETAMLPGTRVIVTVAYDVERPGGWFMSFGFMRSMFTPAVRYEGSFRAAIALAAVPAAAAVEPAVASMPAPAPKKRKNVQFELSGADNKNKDFNGDKNEDFNGDKNEDKNKDEAEDNDSSSGGRPEAKRAKLLRALRPPPVELPKDLRPYTAPKTRAVGRPLLGPRTLEPGTVIFPATGNGDVNLLAGLENVRLIRVPVQLLSSVPEEEDEWTRLRAWWQQLADARMALVPQEWSTMLLSS